MYKYFLLFVGYILNRKVVVLEDFEYEKYYCFEQYSLDGARFVLPFFYGNMFLFLNDDGTVVTHLGYTHYVKKWKYV